MGIDEAGYGPNLGPLVLTAVVAESKTGSLPGGCAEARTLDFWGDLAATVDRAGGDPARLWVDDSKAIFRAGKGRDRLECACWAALDAAGHPLPGSFVEFVAGLAQAHRSKPSYRTGSNMVSRPPRSRR